MGIVHFDEVRRYEVSIGHIRATWSLLGEGAGSVGIGVRRLEVPAGGWTTPVHEHGREEELFYVLSGRGVSLQGEGYAPIEAGDCIVYLPGQGAHSVHALEQLDLLAFGRRERDESPRFPRLGLSLIGRRGVETIAAAGEYPIQFEREAELGPPELPSTLDPRPPTIANLSTIAPDTLERANVARTRRNLGRAAGSVSTGLQHVEVLAGKESTAQHCHSVEEELFVVLAGEGALILGEQELPVRPGSVVARPPATGVAHVFRAGASGLTYLAYGTRDPADVCYYPRSNKIAFRGVGLMARLERLDYWDGED